MSDKKVKVECSNDGHISDWVEYDTKDWTVKHFREITVKDMVTGLPQYLEVYASDWSITGLDGELVPFPGQGAHESKWLAAYDKMDLEMSGWLAFSPVHALNKRMNPPPKSSGKNSRRRSKRRTAAA